MLHGRPQVRATAIFITYEEPSFVGATGMGFKIIRLQQLSVHYKEFELLGLR